MFNHPIMLQISSQSHYPFQSSENMSITLECVINAIFRVMFLVILRRSLCSDILFLIMVLLYVFHKKLLNRQHRIHRIQCKILKWRLQESLAKVKDIGWSPLSYYHKYERTHSFATHLSYENKSISLSLFSLIHFDRLSKFFYLQYITI